MTPARSDLRWWEWLLTGAVIGDVLNNWRRDRRERRAMRRAMQDQRSFLSALGHAGNKAVEGFNEAAAAALRGRW